jgi:hypothetical protein
MITTEQQAWLEANQRYLMASLALVRKCMLSHRRDLEATTGASQVRDSVLEEEIRRWAETLPAPAALDSLCAAFGLSHFERHLLLLCAGVELDSSFPADCAAAQGDRRRTYPTFSLALATLPEAHWSAITPVAPLRRWRLIEVGPGGSVTTCPLRIDEHILHYLTGVRYVDERIQGLLEPFSVPADLLPSQEKLAHWVQRVWSRDAGTRFGACRPVIQLCGPGHSEKRAVAAAACLRLGLELEVMRASYIPVTVSEREALARLWEREALLSESALLVDCDDLDITEMARSVLPFVEALQGLAIITTREPLPFRRRSSVRLDVQKPTVMEQRKLWANTLGSLAHGHNGKLEAMASQFQLDPEKIFEVCATVTEGQHVDASIAGSAVWEACRVQSRSRLNDLAQRIESSNGWEDLVLPDPQLQILREIAAQVRNRFTVYESWGFAGKGNRGLGIGALFAGLSGTGKTLAAEVLANDLQLDLYRIDLSSVVSKYIGETEKNLRRVFDAAEDSGAVLLFDEADALFGKRSEVRDSHDRYANVEISYLLQRMEAYRGLAILTTNMKSALDSAFQRRLRFVVHFPFPGQEHREEIWRKIFPVATPVQGLDCAKLARLHVAGGHIRNIAVNAAFLAAGSGEPVGMVHLLQAAHSEAAKREQPLSDAETRGWV